MNFATLTWIAAWIDCWMFWGLRVSALQHSTCWPSLSSRVCRSAPWSSLLRPDGSPSGPASPHTHSTHHISSSFTDSDLSAVFDLAASTIICWASRILKTSFLRSSVPERLRRNICPKPTSWRPCVCLVNSDYILTRCWWSSWDGHETAEIMRSRSLWVCRNLTGWIRP